MAVGEREGRWVREREKIGEKKSKGYMVDFLAALPFHSLSNSGNAITGNSSRYSTEPSSPGEGERRGWCTHIYIYITM